MQISKFQPIESKLLEIGLAPFTMDRLGMVVALAGPNGAGKSRILETLRVHVAEGEETRKATYNAKLGQLDDLRKAIEAAESGTKFAPNRSDVPMWKSRIKTIESEISTFHSVVTSPASIARIQVVNFVPKKLDLADSSDASPRTLKERFDKAQQAGVETLNQSATSYIQHLQNIWKEVTHQEFKGSTEEISGVVSKYSELVEIVEKLLKAKITRSVEGEACIFGKPIPKTALSEGQKVLLQLAVALHAQRTGEDLILVMDEPENHLHPGALINVIDGIRVALPGAQIWIATHSVPLLAHLYSIDSQCIWYVSEGSVSFASKKTEEVLLGLLGGPHQRERLLNFLELPHQLAASNFSAQCLTNPSVVPLRSGDPQMAQAMSAIRKIRLDIAPAKLLDIGAGKGRLLGGLAEIDSSIAEHLDYVAFDSSTSDQRECESQISTVFGSASNRWFSIDESLFSAHEKKSFDFAVMCNVLHEIAPDHWLTLFGRTGPIQRALRETGYLLIVEDMRIPIGELPNERGFFLLDTLHLRTLFSISSEDDDKGHFYSFDARGDGRLKAHLLSSAVIERISPTTRKAAIEELKESAKKGVSTARERRPPTFSTGQDHALWSQQLANCLLYLDQI